MKQSLQAKEWYKDHIGVYENMIPKSYCDKVIDFFEKGVSKGEDVSYRDEALTHQKRDVAVHVRLDQQTKNSLALEFFEKGMIPILELYGKKYGYFQEMMMYQDVPPLFCDFKIQKTNPSEGYHIWHPENSGGISSKRIMVWTLYLNDVEEGGETEFLNQSVRVPAKTGQVCLFPPYYTHLHRGNPPLSGTKYIATGWITQDFKNLIEHPSNEYKTAEDFIIDGHWNETPIIPLIEKHYNERFSKKI